MSRSLTRVPTIFSGPMGMGDFDLTNIPIIGGLFQWTQDTAAAAIRSIVDRFYEYKAAKQLLPILEEQQRRAALLVQRDQRADLAPNVQQWGKSVADARNVIGTGDGKVQTVVDWYNRVDPSAGFAGMGAVPIVIPVAIAAVIGVAIYTMNNAISRVSEAHRLSQFVKAGLTPEQITDVYRGAGDQSAGGFAAILGNLGTLAKVGVFAAVLYFGAPLLMKAVNAKKAK